MPSIYQLKPLFQQSLGGMVRRLAAAGASALLAGPGIRNGAWGEDG